MNVNSLEDVRHNIDRIDRQIIKLLGERQAFVQHAAQFKTSADDVKAPAREKLLLPKFATWHHSII